MATNSAQSNSEQSNKNQLNIRCPADLKTRFIEAAKENGTSASELIIDFMRQYLGEVSAERLEIDVKTLIDKRIDERLAEFEERLGRQRVGKRKAA